MEPTWRQGAGGTREELGREEGEGGRKREEARVWLDPRDIVVLHESQILEGGYEKILWKMYRIHHKKQCCSPMAQEK